MAQLIVRNVDDNLKMMLQIQAKHKGRSMEEEVRRILAKSVEGKRSNFGSQIAEYFKEAGFDGDLERMDGGELRVPNFDE